MKDLDGRERGMVVEGERVPPIREAGIGSRKWISLALYIGERYYFMHHLWIARVRLYVDRDFWIKRLW